MATSDTELFMQRFAGRSDVFAEQQDDGSYRPVHRTMNDTDVAEHMRGERTYGIYTVRPDNTTKVLVFDIDSGRYTDVATLLDTLDIMGVPPQCQLVEHSGCKGWHVWLFLEHWTSSQDAYKAVRAVLQVAKMQGTEAYPKQESVEPDKPLGNLIKIPQGFHKGCQKWSHYVPDTVDLAHIQPLPDDVFRDLVMEYDETHEPMNRAGTIPIMGYQKPLPCIYRITHDGVGKGMRDNALFTLALDAKRNGLTVEEAEERLLAANANFTPPKPPSVIREKVRSAYTSVAEGFSCEQPFLHKPEHLLCSRLCPRYPAIRGMPATDDAPPESAGGGGAAPSDWLPSPMVPGFVKSAKERRRDGKTVVELDHPDLEEPVYAVLKPKEKH